MICLLQEEREMDLYRSYTAQCLWGIDTICHHNAGYENEMPQYVEIIHPEAKAKPMTADEIKAHVLERLK